MITVPLGLLLLFVLLIALIVLQVNDTFLNPDYYPQQLKNADMYRFMLNDVPTSALDDARELGPEDLPQQFDENPLVTLGLSTEEIVTSLNRAVPPEWVEATVEDVFDELGRYIAGERDDFEITVQAEDRVVATVAELEHLVGQSDFYDLFFEAVAAPAIEDAVARGLPLDLDITSEEIVEAIRRVIPREWLEAQLEIALAEFTPYLVGEQESFEITIELSDRVAVALQEIKVLLREADAYAVLYDEAVDPVLAEGFGGSLLLPFGIEVTNEEASSALREVAPAEWVREQAELIIDNASPYIAGESDTFEILVSLEENKQKARDLIAKTVGTKLEAAVARLPSCAPGTTLDEVFSLEALSLPACVPQGVDTRAVLDMVEPYVIDAVDNIVLNSIPDQVPFSEADLRETLIIAGAEENLRRLDEVRGIIKSGWTYTDVDFREDLLQLGGQDALTRFDDARALLSDGWTYNREDFRQNILEAGGSTTLENFDQFRGNFDLARTLRWLIFLPIVLLIAAIAFLGGRRWASRVAWAAGSLGVVSLIILIAAGPIYGYVSALVVGDARVEAFRDSVAEGNFAHTQQLISDKAFDMAQAVIDGFTSGIAIKSGIILGLALLALVVSLTWGHINLSWFRLKLLLWKARLGRSA